MPHFGRSPKPTPPRYRNVRHRIADELLAEPHQVGIRPLGGEQGDGGRHEGQADEGFGGAHSGQHLAQQVGGLGRPLARVHMRIGAIHHQHVARFHQPLRNVAVQIMRHDDRHGRTDDPPQHRQQRAVAVLVAGRRGRTVARHVHRVDRQRRGQPVAHPVAEIQEQRLFDRAAGRCARHQDRHRSPRPGRIHARIEAGQLGRQMADLARQAGDRLAFLPALALEIVAGRRRSEGVGFQMQPDYRHARCTHAKRPGA